MRSWRNRRFVAARCRRARWLVAIAILAAICCASDSYGRRLDCGSIRVQDTQTLRMLVPSPVDDNICATVATSWPRIKRATSPSFPSCLDLSFGAEYLLQAIAALVGEEMLMASLFWNEPRAFLAGL